LAEKANADFQSLGDNEFLDYNPNRLLTKDQLEAKQIADMEKASIIPQGQTEDLLTISKKAKQKLRQDLIGSNVQADSRNLRPEQIKKINAYAEELNANPDAWNDLYRKGVLKDPHFPGAADITGDDLLSLMDEVTIRSGYTGKKAPFIDLKSQRGSVGAYHGSPHKFDQFGPLDEVVGTGEGVQAFGHGLYFTSEKDIANHYAKDLSARAKVIPYDYSKISDNQRKAIETIKSIGSKSDAVKLAKAKKNPLLSTIETIDEDKIFGPKGNTYQVTLHKGKTPDQYDYIKWDEPISEKIVDKLRDRLSGGMDHKQEEIVDFLDAYQGKNRLTDNGEDIYKEISRIMGSDKAASDILLYGGVDGIDYPAGSLSMFGGGGFTKNQRNYVVFDPKAVTIESVNGSPINKTGFSAPATMAGAGALAGLGLTGKAIYDNKKKAGKK
jgi:hypothetical protein